MANCLSHGARRQLVRVFERLEPRTLRYGGPTSAQFLVNTYTTSRQQSGEVAMDSDGDFVLVWASLNQDGSGYGIYGQRYNSANIPQGSEFRVNSYTTDYQ